MSGCVGLDLSLTGTGIAEWNGETRRVGTKSLRGVERLDHIEREIADTMIRAYDADPCVRAVIEGYSFNSQASHAHALGELGGVVRLMLHRMGIPYLVVPPTSLKKYATGAGNADKYDVRRAAEVRLGFTGNNDDESDALWLRTIGMDLMGMPVIEMPKVNRHALDGLRDEWEWVA